MSPNVTADVCLILEGTYPYVSGGVSGWTHDFIQNHKHLTFSLMTLVSADAPTELVYELPPNVIGVQTLRLQQLPEGALTLPLKDEKRLFNVFEQFLLRLQSDARLDDLAMLIDALSPHRGLLGKRILLNSPAMWDLLLSMYQKTMVKTSFLDYFWSWRGLFGGMFGVLLADLPRARAYHALCTGYAGLLMARARIETGRPCIVTEHGIYTNERRIEIASADWLDDPTQFSLAVSTEKKDRELKDFWIDTFGNYSRFCYEAADPIITLYEGNQEFQRMDGAAPEKLRIIPNGIDPDRYNAVQRSQHPPTVALIGRVVPIKDVKTYIKAAQILKQSVPQLRAFILGPDDEDKEYAAECRDLVKYLKLEDTIVFTGKVNIEEYLGEIDVVVLTSISEAQPLVVLEAGAAGIPVVATDVGACSEMILGASHENPNLGAGGAIVPLANPQAVASALQGLLANESYYQKCSKSLARRVRQNYNKADQCAAYAELYHRLIKDGDGDIESNQKQAA